MQDFLLVRLDAQNVRVHTVWFHHRQTLTRALGAQVVQFGLVKDAALIVGCDTLIYFWTKNKPEALFQMTNLLLLMLVGCDVFVVGKNHSGARSAEAMLDVWCPLGKIDSVPRCWQPSSSRFKAMWPISVAEPTSCRRSWRKA